MKISLKVLFGLLCSLGAAAALHAETTDADDWLTLRVGAMRVDGDARFNGQSNGQADNYGFATDRFAFGDRIVPRVEGMVHFSERNGLLFNYFRYNRASDYTLDRDTAIDDIVITSGSEASAGARVALGTLVYDYAVLETPRSSVGLQFGAAWGLVEGHVQASTGLGIVRDRQSTSGFAPVLGARFSSTTADRKWGFVAQGQYVNASWGNLDHYRGDVTRLNALVEYRFTRAFGLFAGYDSFRLNVDHDFGNVTGGVILRFMGPTAGMTFIF